MGDARPTLAQRERVQARARRMATFYSGSSTRLQARVEDGLRRRLRAVVERER